MIQLKGNYLDEASGLKKKEAELVLATMSSDRQKLVNTSSWNRNIIKAKRVTNVETNLLSAKMIERSQLKFKDKINNNNKPFVPIITDKPNSLKPLSILVEKSEDGFESYSHPYEFEIEKFEPNSRFLEIEIPEVTDILVIFFLLFSSKVTETAFGDPLPIHRS